MEENNKNTVEVKNTNELNDEVMGEVSGGLVRLILANNDTNSPTPHIGKCTPKESDEIEDLLTPKALF